MINAMKIYLWYDKIAKKYVTGRATDYDIPCSEALFAFELEHIALSQKIARNLNKIK